MKWKNSCRCPLSIINVYQENLGKKFCYEFCPLNEIKNTQCILEILRKYRKSEKLGICVKYFLSFPQEETSHQRKLGQTKCIYFLIFE